MGAGNEGDSLGAVFASRRRSNGLVDDLIFTFILGIVFLVFKLLDFLDWVPKFSRRVSEIGRKRGKA